MSGITNWRIVSTQSTAGYLGGGLVAGGGQFNFELSDGIRNSYSASYRGIGTGLGAGLRGVPSGRVISFIMDYYMPLIRTMINAVGSQDVYLSNLYSVQNETIDWPNLNDNLYIFSLGGEIGAGLSGSLFIWEDYTRRAGVSSLTARLGEMTPTLTPRVTAMALGVGFGVGLVGVSGTVTMCTCSRFSPA